MPRIERRWDNDAAGLRSLMGLDVFILLFLCSLLLSVLLWKSTSHWRNEAQRTADAVAPRREDQILLLEEGKGFTFEPGRAELTEQFREKLRYEVAPRLVVLANALDTKRIEVVGHTDGQKHKPTMSNLDVTLFKSPLPPAADVADQNVVSPNAPQIASDNAGLGLMRAAAVASFLVEDAVASEKLKNFIVVPMSAGALMLPDGTMAKASFRPDRDRRRIEIRVLRLQY